jgi:heme exporter protein C
VIKKFIHQFASPKTYLFQVTRAYPYIFVISVFIYIIAIFWGLFLTPEDFVQGNSYRIIYLHVPASFISQGLYVGMAIASATFIALISGSIWGIPTWGTWWAWDARIVSTLILFIMYLGLIALHDSFANYEKADKFLAVLVLVGSVNIPIIKMSVEWWSTLHQSASITISDKPTIDPSMLYPLFGSMIGFTGIVVCLVILSSKLHIFIREKNKSWIKDYV